MRVRISGAVRRGAARVHGVRRRPNPGKLQDVFLKIHTHIDTLREADKLQSWIYQIARNAIHDYYRMHQTALELPEMSYMPDDRFDDVVSELIPCIQHMIDDLPADYRQALILTEYEGLTQKELAERLGISLSGAKSRVQRAREKLKIMLLNCCHFEFDRLGRVINYWPHCCPYPDVYSGSK
ncbi:MAG TPA: RNA polymerase sigma factor SigZ [Ktedonobacteraceae bacterium]|nr:RNA polymerase sigma factor SigZ [Ktedonobacteraceae bacterium]